MATATTLPDRIRILMDAMGWTRYAEVAKACGAAASTVARWVKDGQITMDARFAYELQLATGFSGWWIALGIGPQRLADVEAFVSREVRKKLLGHAEAMVSILTESQAA